MSEMYFPHYERYDGDQIDVIEDLYRVHRDEKGTVRALITLGWSDTEARQAVRDMFEEMD